MNDELNMTTVSRYMYDTATSGKLSLREAIEVLGKNAKIRSARDILVRFSGVGADSDEELGAYVLKAMTEADPDANRDSVRRKISNWIRSNGEIGKDSAIKLAFALKLSYGEADELLKLTCSEGFHWRDPDDIVYAYSLLNAFSYVEARELRARLDGMGLLTPNLSPLAGGNVMLTYLIRERATALKGEDELIGFLEAERDNLGYLHNTAYSIFIKYLDILQNPAVDSYYCEGLSSESDGRGSEEWNALCNPAAYSIREILTEYLHIAHIPKDVRRRGENNTLASPVLSAIQKSIRAHWPDETALSKMKSRTADVSRKALILLFIAADGFEDNEYSYLEQERTDEEEFEDTYLRLNGMLTGCGFAPLDARSPFDWMMIFCLCSGSKELVDSRIEKFLKEIFDSDT